jgi:hypothetical protein
MSVSCECCVLSEKGLCDGSNTRPAGTYRVCESEYDLGTSTTKSSWPTRTVEPREREKRQIHGMITSESLALADTSPKCKSN